MFPSRSSTAVISASLLCLAFSPSARAQVAGGTISGTVSDTSGAVVPNAQVVMRHQATSVTRTLVTNDQGFYSAPNLSPGRYQVNISAVGFATEVQENLLLTVGQEVVANIQLKVGGAAEKVEVTAQAPQVDLGSSTLNTNVGAKTILELPLNGRDWTQLAALEPGVVVINTQKPIQTGANARVNGGWGSELTISGNRPQQSNYRLDGISISDYSGGGPGSVLGGSVGVDAVQEFSVVTSNASAEYGKTSGGVLNAITRSGTNQFHGSAYEFLRNSALDARNFFDGVTTPPFKRNQFGASAGGPIRKDRTFIFGDYEGLRQSLSTTTLDRVPSRAAHNGTLRNPNGPGTISVAIDRKVVPFLNLFPLPNGPEGGDTGIFSVVGKNITSQDFFTTRADHRFSEADSLYGTYLNDDSQTAGPDIYEFSTSSLVARRHLATLGENHIFSPSLANFARLGFSRVVAQGPVPGSAIDPRAADTSLGFLPGDPVGVITISGISTFSGGVGAQAESVYHYNSYQAYDDIFHTRHSHSLKFGFNVERIQSNLSQTNQPIGSYTFASLMAFLRNQPQQFSSPIPGAQPTLGLRQMVLGAYAQDDWRVRPNLTINLGLRYEFATVPSEEHNRLSTLVNLTDAQPKVGSPYFQNPTSRDFSPRVGFSWDPFRNGKTAIRGGFGLYDTLPLTYQLIGFITAVSPFSLLGNVQNPPQGTFPAGGLQLLTPNNIRVAYVQQDPKRSYVLQWNFNIQREIFAGMVFQAGYTGAHGVHQPFRSNDVDIVLPTLTPQGFLWPTNKGTRLNPNVGRIEGLAWFVSTAYDGLDLRLTRRMSHGLQLQTSYTWSKSIDSGSASINGGTFDNGLVGPPLFWPQVLRGLSDFDVRHIFVINSLWNIPGPQSARGIPGSLARGWQLSGIFRATSGQPFTPSIAGDALGVSNSSPFDFPNRLAGPGCDSLVNPGNPNHYIKTQCFAAPNPVTLLGNGGRNIAIGPGLAALDFSLIKDTPISRISESFRVQFRTEFFNLLNRANFEAPTRPADQVFQFQSASKTLQPLTGAGVLFRTATTSRQIQFGLKLIW